MNDYPGNSAPENIDDLLHSISAHLSVNSVYRNKQAIYIAGHCADPNAVRLSEIRNTILLHGYVPHIEEDGEINSNLFITMTPRAVQEQTQRRRWLSSPAVNIVLFLLTCITVTYTGAFFSIGSDLDQWSLWAGVQYAAALLTILFAHEMGHYLAARHHGIDCTLPYFLPGILLPASIFGGPITTGVFPGTFGAFIKMKNPIRNKSQLMDVGAAGPIAGFVVCLLVLIYGFVSLPGPEYLSYLHPEGLSTDGEALTFGNSILFYLMGEYLAINPVPPMTEIYHYPLLSAGWVGLLVTALNMLPIGQLDGGHIVYALFGRKAHAIVAYSALFGILGLAVFGSSEDWFALNWVVFALLIILVIRVKHPPVMDETSPLDLKRKLVGAFALAILVLCFIPMPVYFS